MSNSSNISDSNSPRRLFVQSGGASATASLNLPYMFTSGQLGISDEIDTATTTRLKKTTSSITTTATQNQDELIVEEQKLINKSIAELFYNNHNITDKKRAGYGKNVIEQAPSIHGESGGFFLDDDYDDIDEEEQEEDYEDDEDRETRKEFEKISQELSEQLKNSPYKNEYLDSISNSNKQSMKDVTSPRISLKTGLSSSELNSSRSSSRNSGATTMTNSTTSIKSSDKLKIDPNYKWLLKDLKLTNNKRVIDVTDLIDLNESQKYDKENIKNTNPNNNHNVNNSSQNIVNESITIDNNNKEESNNDSLLKQEQKLNQSDSDINANEDYKNDSSFISKLYKKLVNTSGDNIDKTTDIEDEQKEKDNEHVIREIGDINNNDDDDADEEDDEEDDELLKAYANHNDSVYNKYTATYRDKHNKNVKSESTATTTTTSNDEIEEYENYKIKKEEIKNQRETLKGSRQQFSKSFEISLDDIDNLIDRVDSGIKLKRSNNNSKKSTDKELNILQKHQESKSPEQQKAPKTEITIESLKQEWSQMFNKLEQDYKSKLDEQQKQNEFKLKQLHEEIKQSIILQQQSINNEIQHQQQHQRKEEINHQEHKQDLKSTITVETKESFSKQSSTNSNSPNSTTQTLNSNKPPNLLDNNSKYITNLRLELKSKHSRHVQDLKEYYEKELDELKRKLNFYEKQHRPNSSQNNAKLNGDLVGNESDTNSVNDLDVVEHYSDMTSSSKHQQQLVNDKNHAALNSELKNSNSNLLNQLYESSQHIRYLTQENCDLTNKINQMDVELKQANEKISNLEHCCQQLELQLTDTIKLQDQYIRELHAEKRNLVKKMQECEELKMSCKFYEQKCDTLELKLDEKDSVITRLKTQLIQAETEFNRLEYEYKKSMSNTKMTQSISEKSKTSLGGQQITIKQQIQSQQQQQQQGQHPIPVIITNTNSNGSVTSTSSVSPSSPNSMSKTTITSSSTNQTKSTNGSLTNGFTNSSSMTQLNSQRINFQNDTLNGLNNTNSINNVASLLITDATKDPNNNSNLRQFQFSTDRINSYSRRSQHDYQQNPFRQSRNMSVSPSRLIERDDLNRNFKSPITGSSTANNLHSTSVYSIKANSKFQSDILGSDNNVTNNNVTKLNECKQSTQQMQQQQQQSLTNGTSSSNITPNGSSTNGGLFKLVPDIQLKYIEHLELEFDMLMKHKQQLDAQLTRLPYKATNTNMHTLRQSVENELNLVEKKLASVKLELRKLNIIKTH